MIITILIIQSFAILYLLFRKRDITRETIINNGFIHKIPDSIPIDSKLIPPTNVDDDIVATILLSLSEEYDLWQNQIGSFDSLCLTRGEYDITIFTKDDKVDFITLSTPPVRLRIDAKYYKYFQYFLDTTLTELSNKKTVNIISKMEEARKTIKKDLLTPKTIRLLKLKELE